ncbi:MAG: serine/threonine protein kinase [Cyanobacteria bacterium REEB67]|nr:serine/threonine protein kinase [Cyanobacteria bacterium REEB67]
MTGSGRDSNRLGDTTLTSRLSGETRTFVAGDVIDGAYRLTRPLGHGGMGVVFACHHEILNQDYAIKILSGESLDGESWGRFQAEAQALAKLKHPAIVGVHNMGIADGRFPYFIMDLLQGETLDQRIARSGHLPVGEALDIFIQVADALSTAHNQGIIHRDIKPSNLMLYKASGETNTRVKIVDFGIARLTTQGFNAQTQTATGMVFGTPYYMSPEQCQGVRADQRSDIYSFGCSLFETLTGQLPFAGENAFQTFMMHQTQEMPSLASCASGEVQGGYPDSLEKALEKMLAKKTSDRYQTMSQVKVDLERIKAGKSIIVQGITYGTPSAEMQSQTRTRPIKEDGDGRPAGLDDRNEADRITRPQPYGSAATQKRRPADKPERPSAPARRITARRDKDVDESDAAEQEVNPLKKLKTAGMVLLAVALVGLISFGAYKFFNSSDVRPGDSIELTADELDDEDIITYDYDRFKADERKLAAKIEAYKNNPLTAHSYFRQGDPPRFVFPKDFYMCSVRFGDEPPIFGCGTITIPANKRVSVQFSNFTEKWPEILKKFRPFDLNGLEIVTKDPHEVFKLLASWQSLDDLNFFNTIVKAMPRNEFKYDESDLNDEDLPTIDKFTRLKALGLCGPKLSGEAIAKMQLLSTIHTLRLKRISNLPPLLEALAGHPNITELWLGSENLNDSDLKPLLKLKTLETLRIRRSMLTTASAAYFKKMPALKHLFLDRSWTRQEKKQFKRDVPGTMFEHSAEFKYWQMFPDEK